MLPYKTYSICVVWITALFCIVTGIPWIANNQEALDTYHDLAVYNAVVESMNEWQKRHDLKKVGNRTKREEPSVCYEKLGCFDASGPFGYLDMLPSKPDEINTRFLMYPARTRQRRSGSLPTEVPFEKMDEAFEWARSGFNRTLPTKVLIHGFGSDCGYIWAYEIRSALMAVEEINSICVDWSNGAALPNYVKASANTRLVGKQVSLLLRGLVEKNGLSLRNTHLIGFSLGAHIAGFAGADLGNLSRITGLDPAGPLFESQDTRARLDETDASFVDVIHSNGENLILGGLGSSQPMGHVDFYPNGGRMQKGCSHLFVGAVSDIIWSSAVEGRSLCNHRRATKFFIDSVSPRCHFPAFPCDTYDNFLAGKCFPCSEESKCGNMGYYADRSKGRGQLYLITRDEEPFCAHQYLVRIETSASPLPVKSYGKIQVTLVGDSYLNETFLLTRKEDEELKLGEPVSKIVVLHPLLSQPIKIELLYTAYSGWLSSGLSQWKIDKIMLMDSFGKISSVCKKNHILESGKPVILPLYPKDCDIRDNNNDSMDNNSEEEIKLDKAENVHVGYLNSKEESTNSLDDVEAESSRAFNSRVIIKADKLNKNPDTLNREVVEPILKPQATKNGRAHVESNLTQKSEITEPILGATTLKSADKKEGLEGEVLKGESRPEETYRKPEDSKSLRDPMFGYERSRNPSPNPLDAIVTTVQFLPQRLARMFEQAEKYARETFLPLVSTYTPRFISDFIGQQREEPKYVPLHYEEEEEIQKASESNAPMSNIQQRSISVDSATSGESFNKIPVDSTPYTHIQRIIKKAQKVTLEDSVPSESSGVPVVTESVALTSATFSDINPIFPNPNKSFNIRIDYYGEKPKNKRQNVIADSRESEPTLIETVANVLQNIPDNLSRVLSQVQNYTRSNLLPFVQNYAPRNLADLIWIRTSTPRTTLKVESSGNVTQKSTRVSLTIESDEKGATSTSSDISISSTEDTSVETDAIRNEVLERNAPSISSTATTSLVQSSTVEDSVTSTSSSTTVDNNLRGPNSINTEEPYTIQNEIRRGDSRGILEDNASTSSTMSMVQNSTVEDSVTSTSSSTTADNNLIGPNSIDTEYLNPNDIIEDNVSTTSTVEGLVASTISSTTADSNPRSPNSIDTERTEDPTAERSDIIEDNASTSSTASMVQSSTAEDSVTITPSSTTADNNLIGPNSIDTDDLKPNNIIEENVSTTSTDASIIQNSTVKGLVASTISTGPILEDSPPIFKFLTTNAPVKPRNHVQRIPKRGEKFLYARPQRFTIVIDPRDLTTRAPTSVSTTTGIYNGKFESYIQKIPKKKGIQRDFRFLKRDPWIGRMGTGRDLPVQNSYGENVVLKLSSDGRYVL